MKSVLWLVNLAMFSDNMLFFQINLKSDLTELCPESLRSFTSAPQRSCPLDNHWAINVDDRARLSRKFNCRFDWHISIFSVQGGQMFVSLSLSLCLSLNLFLSHSFPSSSIFQYLSDYLTFIHHHHHHHHVPVSTRKVGCNGPPTRLVALESLDRQVRICTGRRWSSRACRETDGNEEFSVVTFKQKKGASTNSVVITQSWHLC